MATLAEQIAAKKAAENAARATQSSAGNASGPQQNSHAAIETKTSPQTSTPAITPTNPPAKPINPLAAALGKSIASKPTTIADIQPNNSAKAVNPLAAALARNKQAPGAIPLVSTTPPVAPAGAIGDEQPDGSFSKSDAPASSDSDDDDEAEIEAPPVSPADTHFNHPTQPDAMPADVEADLRKNLQMLKDNLADRPLVAQAIPHIMYILQANPHLRDILLPEDCQTMVRALRQNYGTAIKEKQAKTEKKTKKQNENTEIAGELAGIMASLK